jgi:hypothetical protein
MLNARTGVERYNSSLEAAKKQITGGLTPAMMGINTSKLEQMGMQMSATTTKTSRLKSHVDKLNNTLSGLNGVVSGLIGLGLVYWLKSTVDKAIHSQHEWDKLNAVLKEHGGNLETAKKEITDLASQYGFAKGEVREASHVFMQAGMTYQELTKNQGALTTAMALSVGTGRNVSESAKLLQKAYMGQGRALKELGMDIKEYKDETTGVIDKERLNQDILTKTASQLEAHGKSGEATIMRYNNSIEKLQTTIGEKLLPILTPFLETVTKLINKFVEAPSYTHYLTAGLLALAAGGMILAPIILSLGVVGNAIKKIGSEFKKLGGFFGSKHKLDMDCGVCPPGTVVGDQSGSWGKGKGTKSKGKTGRLGKITRKIPGIGRLSGLMGKIPGGGRLLGLLSGMGGISGLGSLAGGTTAKLTGLLGGGLKGLGGLGRLGGLAAGAARFAGPIGLAITAATAGYGAYQGWNETKGPVQEKAKGALGGAVEQLSFGLINKQQTMDGINWLYNQTKDIPSKIGGFLGQVKDIITKPFVNAWNTANTIVGNGVNHVVSFFTKLINRSRNILNTIIIIVTSPFTNAWNTAKNIVNESVRGVITFFNNLINTSRGILNTIISIVTSPFTRAWNTAKQLVTDGVNNISSTMTRLPDIAGQALGRMFDTVKGWAEQITGQFGGIICKILGCSPGIIPAFRKLGKEVPRQVAKTLPYLTDLSNAMAIPSTTLEVSAIPSLDPSALDSLTIPLKSGGGSGGYNLASSSSVVSNSSIYHDHNHYHEPITINARDMSRSEFKSVLLSVLEEGNRRYTPP